MDKSIQQLKEKINRTYELLTIQEAMNKAFTQVKTENNGYHLKDNRSQTLHASCCDQIICYNQNGFGSEDLLFCPQCGKQVVKLRSPHTSKLARNLLVHWHELQIDEEFEKFWDSFGDKIWFVM